MAGMSRSSTGLQALAISPFAISRRATNRLLTKDATLNAWAAGPLISPDGRQISYRWEGGNDTSIRLISMDGTKRDSSLAATMAISCSAWSPDGRYLAGVHYNYTTDPRFRSS